MFHWKVRFMRRGCEPPRPFGKTETVVCASTREEAKDIVRNCQASPGYPITASKTTDSVEFPYFCHCVQPEEGSSQPRPLFPHVSREALATRARELDLTAFSQSLSPDEHRELTFFRGDVKEFWASSREGA